MANYREIVTKAIITKGKKTFTSKHSVIVDKKPTTILGCWVINHKFGGTKGNESININGEYDINIWYSYDNDTKTDVFREKNTYTEIVKMRSRDDINGDEEVIVRSLKQPSCTKIEIDGDTINYSIEKELGIELVGDVKFKIEANDEEDPWDEIVEENKVDDIDKAVNENYLDEV